MDWCLRNVGQEWYIFNLKLKVPLTPVGYRKYQKIQTGWFYFALFFLFSDEYFYARPRNVDAVKDFTGKALTIIQINQRKMFPKLLWEAEEY